MPPALLALALLLAAPPGDLLRDPDLLDWDDGLPALWSVSVGATSPGEGESTLAPLPGGGVLLCGDAGTGRWRLLSQGFEAAAGTVYRLSLEHAARELRREGRQFDNAYAALLLPSGGERPDLHLVHLHDGPRRPAEVLARARAGGRGEVRLFLSKSGAVEVRALRLEALRPEDSYDALVRHMGLHYSHFASKGIDWGKEAARHAAKGRAARTPEAFAAAVLPLLARLEDIHVTIRMPDGTVLPTFRRAFEPNFDLSAVRGALRDPIPLGRLGLAGTAGRELGYLGVASLPGDRAAAAPLLAALEGMLDRRGILLDLRYNDGGDEATAAALAGFLAGEPVVYARHRFRDGPGPGDFGPAAERLLRPREGRRFGGPVVVLVGPGCVSSGEGLALMLAAVEGVLLVGQPTAGCSGNPRPADLPDGVSVSFSRWESLLPDGTPLEGRGVPPDVAVEHRGGGDPTLERGLALLEERARAAGR